MSKKLTALIIVLVVGVFYLGLSWWFTRQDLAIVTANLDNIYDILEGRESDLSGAQGDLTELESELQGVAEDLADESAELQSTQSSLSDMEAELEVTKARLLAIESDAFHLHNPTFEEALDFLDKDRTDSHDYIEGEYVCSHYAADVNNNADEKGIRCAMVDIRFPDSAHAAIAFETVDEGLVYFDPITDDRVRPVIGKRYYKCIEPEPGYKYERPSFNDTIEDIVVIW